jgi:hypothetical protein
MKIIKNGQTHFVYSAYTNRAFERIKLLVQSWETKSDMIHLNNPPKIYKYSVSASL